MARANRLISMVLGVLAIAAAAPAPAAAQTRSESRIEVSANVGALTAASTFRESETFTANVETATLTADHGVKTALGFNVGAAVRIVPQLWVGVQYAVSNSKTRASITAMIPHPLEFAAPRSVQGSMDGVAHDEHNLHVDLMYPLPLHAVDIAVMGGPTFFSLKQDFVSNVTVNETYPFDTATFASATATRLSKSAVGFNAGADVTRPLTPRVGVGALIRYSRANVKFEGSDVAHQTVKAGGVEATAGVRIRF